MLGNTFDYNVKNHSLFLNTHLATLWEIDKYILHALQDLIDQIHTAYSSFEFHKVIFYFNRFCANTLSAFYFDILKDRLYTYGAGSSERIYAQCVLWEILSVLTKLIAPVLSFTAEETWQFMRKEHADFDGGLSIFMESMPQKSSALQNHKLNESWNEIINVRQKVNAALEDARNLKKIGSALEASVAIEPQHQQQKDLLERFFGQLEMIFIVSKVNIRDINASGVLSVSVEPAAGKKCTRCWRYTEDVAQHNGADMCARCKTQLGV
jgi:isoleucyl-tRNA synthetase